MVLKSKLTLEKCVFASVTFFFLFFCWYPRKESYMNTRAIENFISLPYTSGSGFFVFRSPWDVLNCFFFFFFKVYLFKRSALYPFRVNSFISCLVQFASVYSLILRTSHVMFIGANEIFQIVSRKTVFEFWFFKNSIEGKHALFI